MKRIVMIVGGKGGTGKTALTRLLVDELHTGKVIYIAYDADTENPELHEYYQNFGSGVRLLNFLEVAEAKRFFSEIKVESPDVVVIDMPGASGNKSREIITKFGLFKIANDLGYRVTLVTVLNLGFSAITSMKTMVDFCQSQVDYVVVKNLCWDKGMGFGRWEGCQTKLRVAELNGVEIELPELEDSAFDLLIEQSMPYSLEFNPDSIVGKTDSGNRDFDGTVEGIGAIKSAVGDAQRELAERIATLELSVSEFAEIVTQRGESRTQRAKERDLSFEEYFDRDASELDKHQAGAEGFRSPAVENEGQTRHHRAADGDTVRAERYGGLEL